MKRIAAILLLLALLSNYIGLEVCVDYCCNEVESIHFGEASSACHLGDCTEKKMADCCDSDQLTIQPHFQDYTPSNNISVTSWNKLLTCILQFRYPSAIEKTFTNHSYTETNPNGLLSVPIRDLTQITLC